MFAGQFSTESACWRVFPFSCTLDGPKQPIHLGGEVDVDIDSEILKEEESHDDEAELSKEQKEEVAKQTIECIKDRRCFLVLLAVGLDPFCGIG